MAFELPALPSFQIQPPDVYGQAAKMMQLRDLMQQSQYRQQMQPLQLQQEQGAVQQQSIETEMKNLQLQGQKALTEYWRDPSKFSSDAGDFQHNDALAGMLGIDPNDPLMGTGRAMLKAGVPGPMMITELQNTLKTRQEWSKATQEQQSVLKNAFEQLREIAGPIQAEKDANKKQTMIEQAAPGLARWAQFDRSLASIIPNLNAGNFDAFANRLGAEKEAMDFTKKQADAAAAGQKVIAPGETMSPEMKGEAAKEVTVAKAEQPLKLELATAEAKAKQLMEGLTKPGYAFDPATQTTKLTDQTAYLQSNGKLLGYRPVTEKEIKDDTLLINRLGDVHQKLAEYEQALQKPVNDKDKGNIAALLGDDKMKFSLHPGGEMLGSFKLDVPMDRVNAALSAENIKGLSSNARDQLIAYRNMREALVGYKTVLSGSARGSDKQMELLDQAIPIPSITDSDFSKRSIDAFKGNLRVVGQGLPELPGIKSPKQIEDEVWGGEGQGKKKDFFSRFGGQSKAQ